MKRNKNRRNWLKIVAVVFLLLVLGTTAYNLYPEPRLPKNAVIDKLVVYKSKRTLSLMRKANCSNPTEYR